MSSEETNIGYSKKELPGSLGKIGFAILGIGLVVVIVSFFVDHTRAAFNNLIMLMFLTSVGVGGLFLIALEYIAGAVWSTPFRRVIEIITGIVILLPVIAVPVYLNLHDLFHWTHEEVVQGDYSLESKSGYLNVSFFTIRVVVFFALWILFYLLLRKNSLSQDVTGDQLLTKKNIRLSAVFMPVFAVTITFSSIDWIMSLEPHWFSTIFGVYYFSGTVLAALAAGTLAIIMLNEKGYLTKGLVKDHYYSLGALLFAFTNFWAYIAFSQFLLIWYANLPEETFWFLQKWEGSWMIISVGLIFVHFIVPYFGLLSQPSKMDPKRLKLMSIWILFAHWYDLYWLVMPTFSKEEAVFGWMEVAFPILTVGIVILAFVIISRKKNLIPVGDPKLKRGLDFRL